jgi:hypothetical protein
MRGAIAVTSPNIEVDSEDKTAMHQLREFVIRYATDLEIAYSESQKTGKGEVFLRILGGTEHLSPLTVLKNIPSQSFTKTTAGQAS